MKFTVDIKHTRSTCEAYHNAFSIPCKRLQIHIWWELSYNNNSMKVMLISFQFTCNPTKTQTVRKVRVSAPTYITNH